MAEFINTIDVLGDAAVIDSIIDRTITEFKDNVLTTIPDYIFYNCVNLENVQFPNVTGFGHGAFNGCSSLKEITADTFPSVTYIGYNHKPGVFANCTSLETVVWPSVTNYESRDLFLGCTSLISADLPNMTSEGSYCIGMFNGCTALTSVNLPKLNRVGATFFQNCTSLSKVVLPSATVIFDANVFNGCTALKTIDLPVCTQIKGSYCFTKCNSLMALILRSQTICTLGITNAFGDTPIHSGTGYIYVPAALVDSYKAATNWSTYASAFRALEDYTVDGTTTGALDESKI